MAGEQGGTEECGVSETKQYYRVSLLGIALSTLIGLCFWAALYWVLG